MTSPTDSSLIYREVFKRYGELAIAICTYREEMLELTAIDSLSFNAM